MTRLHIIVVLRCAITCNHKEDRPGSPGSGIWMVVAVGDEARYKIVGELWGNGIRRRQVRYLPTPESRKEFKPD